MKLFSVVSFAFGLAVVTASPPTAGLSSFMSKNGNKHMSNLRQELPADHWVGAARIEKEVSPVKMAFNARGGAQLDIRVHKALWAAFAFHIVGALSAAFKPDFVSAHLMSFGGGATGWSAHFLAIMWLGAAYHTFLSIQDGSGGVINVAHKVNIVTIGLACLLAVWQYSQGVYDHQHALGFIVITGAITAVLANNKPGSFF